MKEFLENIQIQQTLVLSLVLFIGVHYFHLDISIWEIGITFLTVIILDFFLQNFPKHSSEKLRLPFSGINAAFGICFFLRSLDIIVYIFAAGISIFSKHIILNNKGRHFLNPSNVGVCISLLLFPQFTWVNILQWGNYTGSISVQYTFVLIMIVSLGIFMITQVGRVFHFKYILDLILPFLILHFILFWIIPYSENWSSFLSFFNISFFIFVFFMMTDPKTVPKTSLGRVFFSVSLVLTFYVLQFFINEAYAILYALLFNTFLLPVIWKIEQIPKKTTIFYGIWYSFLGVLIIYNIHLLGQPDLVFDNLCNQLICK